MKRFISWSPLLFIFVVWFVYSSPFLIKGKVPFPSTYQVNNFAPWSSYPQFGSPVKNGAMPDIITQIYPWKHFTIQSLKNGQIPLWNPYSFAGTPHLANYQSAVLSPFNLLFFILPFNDAWSLLILLQPLLAGIFMYLYIRSLKVSEFGSLVSAISFMFCGFITVWMDYGTLAYAIIFLPFALFAIEKYKSSLQIRWLWLLAIAIPLSLFSGHFQTSLYFLLFLFIYLVYSIIVAKNKKQLLPLFIFSMLGLLLSLPQLLPTIEFYNQSLRSGIYGGMEVIPWSYLPTFLAPDFLGNPVTRNDWFGHYAEWNAYVGVLGLMLAFYAIKLRNKFIYFLFALLIIIFLLAFPSPLLQLLVALHIPVLSTSAASRIIVLFSFVCAILAGFGFDALIKDIAKRNIKPIIVWLMVIGSWFIALLIIILLKLFIPIDKISIAKQNLILPTLIYISAIIAVCLGLIISRIKQKLLIVIPIILVLIISFDMFRFATKWQAFDPKQLMFTDIPLSSALEKISGYQRMVSIPAGQMAVYWQVPVLDGYDPLYINRYGQFMASLSQGQFHDAERSVVTFYKDVPSTPKVMELMNIAYVVHKASDTNMGWTFPYWKYPENQFTLIYDDGSYRIYKNNNTYPHAFIVNSYQVVNDPQRIIDTMLSPKTDLRKEIVLEKNPGFNSSNNTKEGSAIITDYQPNKITIITDSKEKALLFVSDPYYPGWKAYVDGKEIEILRADFAFRTVVVPQGKHTVILRYQPMSFWIGVYSGVASFILMIIISLFLLRKKN